MSVRLAARLFPSLCAGLTALGLPLATRAENADVELASKIILKLMRFDLDLQQKTGGKLEIGAIGSPQAVAAFTKLKGSAIDKGASFVENGVTLGVETENNKPKILLDLTRSESEGLDWDPKIFKISKTVR